MPADPSSSALSAASGLLRGTFSSGGGALQAHWAFSSRWGGGSAPPYAERNLGHHVGDDPAHWRGNRERTAAELGVESVVYMHQVHGDTVTVVERPVEGQVGDSDALVTDRPGLGLATMVADCVPVVLADVSAGVVAAVHAGRRGVSNGVTLRALETMEELGARRQAVQARIGPAICGSCYEVPPEMADEVLQVAPEAGAITPQGTSGLDLRSGVRGVLSAAGIASVELVGPCTRESGDFFSYRAADGGPTGRFAGFVWFTRG